LEVNFLLKSPFKELNQSRNEEIVWEVQKRKK